MADNQQEQGTPPNPPPPELYPPPASHRRDRRSGRIVVVLISLVAAILFWQAGTFDRALVNVGMNAKPCIQNGLGATFCGDAAKSYCEHTEQLRRLAGASDDCDAVLNEY